MKKIKEHLSILIGFPLLIIASIIRMPLIWDFGMVFIIEYIACTVLHITHPTYYNIIRQKKVDEKHQTPAYREWAYKLYWTYLIITLIIFIW